MEREVIQIAVTAAGKVVALCTDSTIWFKEDQWIKIKDVPGLTAEEEEWNERES